LKTNLAHFYFRSVYTKLLGLLMNLHQEVALGFIKAGYPWFKTCGHTVSDEHRGYWCGQQLRTLFAINCYFTTFGEIAKISLYILKAEKDLDLYLGQIYLWMINAVFIFA